MPNALKVAVTGLKVSRGFLKNYLNAPETDLVLVHDIDGARAREVAEAFGVPRWTTDFDEVLASDIDFLDVSTPNHVHAFQIIAALEAGKHVLCQKPMAPTVRDCRRMIEASERTGKTLGMFMFRISDPFAVDMRRAVREGYLGDIAAVRIRNAHRGPYLRGDGLEWRAKKDLVGGGSFMQLGVHPLNYVLWILDDSVDSVMGYAKNLYCRDIIEGEDVVNAVGEMKSGALITLESGYSSIGYSVEIYGTEGHCILTEGELFIDMARDFDGEGLTYRKTEAKNPSRGQSTRIDQTAVEEGIERWRAERNQNRAFAQAILAGDPPPASGEIGMRDVAVCQAIYRSAELGQRVTVQEMIDEAI